MDNVYGLCFNRPKDNLKLNLPDGNSVGPILPTYDGTEKLQNIKNLSKKFNYRHSTFFIPTSYDEVDSNFIAANLSNNNKNQIKMFNIEDTNYIAYTKPSIGGSPSKFLVSEIHKNVKRESYKLTETKETDTPQAYTGIDVSVCDNEPLALLLDEDHFQIVKLPSQKCIVSSKSARKIADASLHKSLRNYFTLLDKQGTIHVFNCAREFPCWSQDLSPKSFDFTEFVSCQFGYHPQSVFVACGENIISFDTRMGKGIGNSLMFSLSNIGSSFEQKIFSTAIDRSPYMYVNCTNSVYLIDERYVKAPILSWNHLLSSGPNYCQLLTVNSEDILLLGSCSDKQICFLSTKSKQAGSIEMYVPETGLPFQTYPVEDTLRNANANDMWYHAAVKQRFASQWTGMAARCLPSDEFCVWTQNVYGDLAHQIYEPIQVASSGLGDYDCPSGWKKVMKKYQNSILDNMKPKSSLNRCKIVHPMMFPLKSKMYKKTSCLYFSKTSEKIFWKTQDIVEAKQKRERPQNSLICNYKSSVVSSRNAYVNNFSDYKTNVCNSLDDVNSYKHKLALSWSRNQEESSSEECQMLYDTTINQDMMFMDEVLYPNSSQPSSPQKENKIGDETRAVLIDEGDFTLLDEGYFNLLIKDE